MRWAIVIGIDDYGDDRMALSAAVSDASAFCDWVTSAEGGDVPKANLRLLLGPRAREGKKDESGTIPAKDNIVTAINQVVVGAADGAERLYFYFAGHGITARVANRDENTLVTPGFDELHTDHSLALRSLTEYFETTPFADQFFFIDACRNVPWADREFEVGRWPVPRRRDPGAEPVQQFILYATSPGRKAAEKGWPGEAKGAFTSVLMKGLSGEGRAKAWSWERNCYEVRWEGLAAFVHDAMAGQRPDGVSDDQWQVQVPQDAGSRGVAGRDRDARVVAFPRGHFPSLDLTVELEADARYDEAEVSVLDAIGEPVVSALRVTGTSQTFTLPPKTYAVRALTTTPVERVGSLTAPVELYESCTEKIELLPRGDRAGGVSERLEPEDVAAAGREEPPGSILIRSADPLAVAEIRDEAGRVVKVAGAGEELEANPGFYRVRQLGPDAPGAETFVVLAAGEQREVELEHPRPARSVGKLARSFGGAIEDGLVRPVAGAEPVTWALRSTVLAAGIGAALHGAELPEDALAAVRRLPRETPGVAVFAVADERALPHVSVRVWPAGEPVPEAPEALEPSADGIGALVRPGCDPEPHWVSIESEGTDPMVVVVPVLPLRLATLVARVGPDRVRVYQSHPVAGEHDSSTPDRLRRVEYLERLLLGGRLDGAEALAKELADGAAEDPFAGCIAGYVLLRLGRQKELGDLASAIAAAAPRLSDAYILRGEYEAFGGRPEGANQAFADAVAAGVPAFGEGLTRLVEGLRVSGLFHPRGALVRHIFQQHAHGSMWAAFTPRRDLQPGRLVIDSADLGFEG